MNLPTEQIIAVLGVLMGYVGRMFTTEANILARLLQVEKDVTAAHQKLRGGPDADHKS